MSLRDLGESPAPPPQKVDAVTMALVGTVLWVLGTVVAAVADTRGADLPEGWSRVCLAGIGLGALMLVWAVFHERRARSQRR